MFRLNDCEFENKVEVLHQTEKWEYTLESSPNATLMAPLDPVLATTLCACHLRGAISLACHCSCKINLRRTIYRSPVHKKLLPSSKSKKAHVPFVIHLLELKNFSYKAASSKMSNDKHDHVCHNCCMAFVTGCPRYYLPSIKI